MIYVAIALGLVATLFMVGLGMAAKRGDEKLAAYHAHRRAMQYGDEWDEEFELRWKWKEEGDGRDT